MPDNQCVSKTKSLTKNSIYYLIYNVLNVLFPFITGIYVAHVLLAGKIGEVAAAQNIAQYFVVLSFLGIPTYALREIAKVRNDKEKINTLYTELFIINFISTSVFLASYVGLIFAVPAYRNSIFLYLVVGGSVALNFLNNSWLFEGLEEFKLISIRNIIFKFVSFILLILLVKSQDDFMWYAAITVIGTAGNYIWNMICSPRFARFTFHGLNFKRHIKPILFLVVVNLAIEIYSMVDITMLDFICASENVAFYSYGSRIQKILLQIINTFTMVLVPRISYCYSQGNIDEFNSLLSRTLRIITILALPMIVGVFFTADFLIVKVYGQPFNNSADVVKILSLLLFISPVGYLLGSRVLLVVGKEKYMIIPVGVGAVANVIGNAVLIPLFKEYGASWASVISEIIVMFIYILLSKKYFKITGEFMTALKVVASCILMGLYLFGCSFIPLNGWIVVSIQIVGAIILYFAILILTKEDMVVNVVKKIIGKLKIKRSLKSKDKKAEEE